MRDGGYSKMQKRKTKLNILDIAIFAVIICTVCVLMFRDTISELIDPAEINNLEIVIKLDDPNFDMSVLKEGNPVRFDPDSSTTPVSDAQIVDVSNDSGIKTVKLICTGYQRFGLIYTENGDRIRVDSGCNLIIDNNVQASTVVSVTKAL